MKKSISCLVTLLVIILVCVSGCRREISLPDGLNGTDTAKLLLAGERLNEHILKTEGDIFENGAETLSHLAEIASKNLEQSAPVQEVKTPSLAGATSVLSLGNPGIRRAAVYETFPEINNTYEYFKELTVRITETATKGADLIDFVKKHIRVVDMWVDSSMSTSGIESKAFLHVENNSETIIQVEGEWIYVCYRYKNAAGKDVYEMYSQRPEQVIRSTYIAGERYEMTYTLHEGRKDYFVAENSKGYWETMSLIRDINWHDQIHDLRFFILKDDICYNASYSPYEGKTILLQVMSSDRKTDLMNIADYEDSSMFEIRFSGFDGVKSVVEDNGNFVLNLQNGMTLDFSTRLGENIDIINISAGGSAWGDTGFLALMLRHPTLTERREAFADVLEQLGLTCRRDFNSVFAGVDRAYAELVGITQFYQWNGHLTKTYDGLEAAVAVEETRLAEMKQIYEAYKSAPVLDVNDREAYELAIPFAALKQKNFSGVKLEQNTVAVGNASVTIDDTLLFVENEPYTVKFALKSSGGLVHLESSESGTATFANEKSFTVTVENVTMELPVLAAGNYTLVAFVSTADGIRTSQYAEVVFDAVDTTTRQTGNILMTPSIATGNTLKLTFTETADVYIECSEVISGYAVLYEVLATEAEKYGVPGEGRVEKLGADGSYTVMIGEEAEIPAGTYRLSYGTVNGEQISEGYVYLNYNQQ